MRFIINQPLQLNPLGLCDQLFVIYHHLKAILRLINSVRYNRFQLLSLINENVDRINRPLDRRTGIESLAIDWAKKKSENNKKFFAMFILCHNFFIRVNNTEGVLPDDEF